MTLWLAYFIGALGVVVEWRAYVLPCAQAFRHWSAAAALLWAVMYALLGAWTAALTMGSTALRTVFSGMLESGQNKHRAAMLFVLLFITLTAITWQGIVS